MLGYANPVPGPSGDMLFRAASIFFADGRDAEPKKLHEFF